MVTQFKVNTQKLKHFDEIWWQDFELIFLFSRNVKMFSYFFFRRQGKIEYILDIVHPK